MAHPVTYCQAGYTNTGSAGYYGAGGGGYGMAGGGYYDERVYRRRQAGLCRRVRVRPARLLFSGCAFGRPGYNPGGLGGPASGLGVRPGLGVGGFRPGALTFPLLRSPSGATPAWTYGFTRGRNGGWLNDGFRGRFYLAAGGLWGAASIASRVRPGVTPVTSRPYSWGRADRANWCVSVPPSRRRRR